MHPKYFYLSLCAAAALIAGCTTTEEKSSTSASVPPSSGSEVSSTNSAPVETAPQTVETPVDDGSGAIVPIKSLPTKKGYPYAIKTKWKGLVKSPYAQDKTLVDVSAMESGKPARCPHTGKIFYVP